MRKKLLVGSGVAVAALLATATPALAQDAEADPFARFGHGPSLVAAGMFIGWLTLNRRIEKRRSLA